jgi:outer membrane protein assembly factor BamA
MILNRFLFVAMLLVCVAISGRSQFQGSAPLSSLAEPLSDTASVSSEDKSPVIIADIFVTGNKKTKAYIIEREIPFKIGNHMMRGDLPAKLELARQQLMNTALFIEVSLKVDRQVEDLVFITVTVKERWYFFPLPYFKIVDRNFNQWWVENKRSLKRVNYGLKLMHNNTSGRADHLQLNLITGYSQQATFRYKQPNADKSLKYGFDVGFAYERNKEISYFTDSNKQKFYKDETRYLSKVFRTDVALIYRPKVRTWHYLRIGYTSLSVDTSIITLNSKFFPDGSTTLRYPEIAYSIDHNNVDYIPYPTKGVTVSASLIKKGLTQAMNLWQLNATATYTIPILERSQLYFQATGAIKLPFDQPFHNKRLFGHGDLYMRGLEYYVADGVAGFVARATARREVLSFNIKPPIVIQGHDKIPFRILLKAYGDIGYVHDKYPTGFSSLSNKWLRSYGVGIDIISFYDVVLRFEYSFNQLNERGLFLHSGSDF